MNKARCSHGMVQDYCAICKKDGMQKASAILKSAEVSGEPLNNPSIPSLPAKRSPNTFCLATTSVKQPVVLGDYALVSTVGANNNPHFLSHLHDGVTFVHVHGHLFVWVLEKILEKLPKLQKLRLIPTMEKRLTSRHREALKARKIELVVGHHRPEGTWKEGENRNPCYRAERMFLLNLTDVRKQLFDELLLHEFEEALITKRYYCLDEHDRFTTHREVAQLFGMTSVTAFGYVGRKIHSVLRYLNPEYQPSADAMAHTETIKNRIVRIRVVIAEQSKRGVYLQRLGLASFPEGMRFSSLDKFEAIHLARISGNLEKLKKVDARAHQVIAWRYGLDDNVFRTLEIIAQTLLGGVSRERARQIEERGLQFLGIEID